MNTNQVSYYIRKMNKIERELKNKEKVVVNEDWNDYQRKAARLCTTLTVTPKQRELVFRLL
jgi:hypothetical protein